MAKKTYRIKVTCSNCGESDVEPGQSYENMGRMVYVWNLIPKGTLVKDFLKNKKCKNCGCKGFLERVYND